MNETQNETLRCGGLPASGFMTGQLLMVEGGWIAQQARVMTAFAGPRAGRAALNIAIKPTWDHQAGT